jgi:hypothetical protein
VKHAKHALLAMVLLVLLARCAFAQVTPEHYGAKGDGITDDSVALQMFFADKQTAIELSPNKRYRFTEPLTIGHGKYFTQDFRGNGSRLIYAGGPGKGYPLRFGEEGAMRGQYCHWQGLKLGIDGEADGGLLVSHGDFTLFTGLMVNGTCREASLRIWQGYSITLQQVFLNGGRYGIMAGIGDGSSANVFAVRDGRILADASIRYSGTTFTFDNVDCSNWSDAAVHLTGAQYGRIHLYTETRAAMTADSAVIRAIRCRSLFISGMLNASKRADYCLDVAECADVFNVGFGNGPRKQFIRVDSKSTNIANQGSWVR